MTATIMLRLLSLPTAPTAVDVEEEEPAPQGANTAAAAAADDVLASKRAELQQLTAAATAEHAAMLAYRRDAQMAQAEVEELRHAVAEKEK